MLTPIAEINEKTEEDLPRLEEKLVAKETVTVERTAEEAVDETGTPLTTKTSEVEENSYS